VISLVAAIALAAGSCSAEIKQDLPEVLVRKLENGLFGKDHLVSVDIRLLYKS
jgi:ADP-ribosyl-[dinitrogen reductase] hydrolase